MKTLIMILIALVTLQTSAQEQNREGRKQRTESKAQYSPEEMAQIKAKQMTLNLDLNATQQKEVSAIFLEEAKMRAKKNETSTRAKDQTQKNTLTKEERLKMRNDHLDHQIEVKKKMKSILSPEQYEKWNKMNQNRAKKGKQMKARNHSKS